MRLRWSIFLAATIAALFIAVPISAAAQPDGRGARSVAPDLRHPSRPAIAADTRRSFAVRPFAAGITTPTVVDPVVSNTNPNLKNTDATGGTEPSVALDPSNPQRVVMTSFSGSFSNTSNAPLWFSSDGGTTWTEEFTIPQPPGRPTGCPCDQTIDFGRNGTLFGIFLINSPTANQFDVVSGDTADPTRAASWQWNGNPAQLADNAHAGNVDQPWLLVNRDPTNATQDDAWGAYDDFSTNPVNAQVAVSRNATPPNYAVDNSPGSESNNGTNPGLRLAKDPRNGAMYALWQTTTGANSPHATTLHLNRSTDAGATWTLNGSTAGQTLPSVNADDGQDFKWGTVNYLLGGVHHLTVDPSNGDVYVVYGTDNANNGNGNQIAIRRLTDNGAGGLTVGAPATVSSAASAGLPSVAVTADGAVGVLYDTFDGNSPGPNSFPQFTAHFAKSTDHGQTFTDTVLEQFLSPSNNDNQACPASNCQRILGDFQQLKSQGHLFYGTFSGNRAPLNGGAGTSIIDPIYFSVFSGATATTLSLSSSANPSVFGQLVTFTATLAPAGATGTVQFQVDGTNLGAPIVLSGGVAVSPALASLSVGTHTVTASYTGDADFLPSSASLTQVVTRAPTLTTLSSAPDPSQFGQSVVFTAVVSPAPPSTAPAQAPTGSVQFSINGTIVATVALTPGTPTSTQSTATFTTSGLLPGSRPVKAIYTGDANFLNSASATLNQVVTCTHNVSDTPGAVIVPAGGSTCIVGAHVGGAVIALPGAALFIDRSTVGGAIIATAPATFGMCDTTEVSGGVSVAGATGFVIVGDPADDGCGGNRIGGALDLERNAGDVEAASNHIGGALILNSTSGVGPFPEDSRAELDNNTIQGSLSCSGNTPAPSNDGHPNVSVGAKLGQCTGL